MAQRNPLPSPLLIPAFLWGLGILAAYLFPLPGNSYLLVPLALGLGVGFVSSRLRIYAVLLCVLLLGGLRLQLYNQRESVFDAIFASRTYIFQPLEFEVRTKLSSQSGAYEIELWSIAEQAIRERVLLYSKIELKPGTAYRAVGDVLPLARDPVLDAMPNKYPAKVYINPHVQELQKQETSIVPGVLALRARGMDALDAKLGEYAGLAKALVFSDSAEKQEWRERLSRSGIMHLVVVSGFHVWFIYFVVMQILNLFLPRKLAEAVFVLAILFFAALNNWAAPITRAIIMIIVMLFARWLSRPVAKAQLLALAFILITALNPMELFSVGFQLSFICVGIILFVRWQVKLFSLEELESSFWKRSLSKTLDLLTLAAVVGLGIYPVTWAYFGSASLNGIIGNLLGIPLIAILIPLSFMMLVLPAGSALFKVLMYSYMWIYELFDLWVSRVSRLPFYYEKMPVRPALWVAGSAAILCFFLFISGRRKALKFFAIGALGVVLLLALKPYLYRSDDLQIHIFNAGVADCSLISLPSGERILVDTGNAFIANRARPGENLDLNLPDNWMQIKLLKWFHKNNINTLDYLILTHMHMDHYGGLPEATRNLKVKNLIISDETLGHPLWQAWEQGDFFAGSQIHTITDTISIYVGQTRLKFLHPDKNYLTSSENNRSLVFRLDHGNVRYLFAADIEAAAEEYILTRYSGELLADFLKVAHHGSKSSSTEAFIRAVMPEQAWVTTSARNKFGFPHREAMDILHKYNSRISYTYQGSIVHRQKKN